jgi:hypothetical protein
LKYYGALFLKKYIRAEIFGASISMKTIKVRDKNEIF